MKFGKRLMALGMAGIMACSCTACGKTASASKENAPIKIGIIQPRSGALAVSGEDSFVGQMIAIEQFNEKGGVNGRMIEAVVADTPDATAAQNEVNRLIQKEGVKVISGVYGSAIAEVAASICNRNGVMYWEAISVTDRLTEQGYENVFRVHTSGTKFGEEAAKIGKQLAEESGIDNPTIAIVSDNGDFGQSIARGVQQFAEREGMNIILDELYASNLQDASPVVLKMKKSDPDILIITSYINDAINITKQAKSLEFSPRIWLGIGSGYGLPAYVEALGKDAEGIIDIDPTNYPVLENLDPEMQELMKDFQKRFEEKQGYAPPTIGYLEWQALWVLLNDVVKVAGGADDLEAMNKAARAIDIPEGTLPAGYGVKFDEKGQNERPVLAAMQWQDGVLTPIYPEKLKVSDARNLPQKPWKER